MNRYQPKAPRAAFGIAAVAMTVLTLGLAVVVPAKLAPEGQSAATLLAARSKAPAATEVRIVPARIEVLGVRESTVAGGAPAAAPVKIKQQG
jgi:hypothetical protein